MAVDVAADVPVADIVTVAAALVTVIVAVEAGSDDPTLSVNVSDCAMLTGNW